MNLQTYLMIKQAYDSSDDQGSPYDYSGPSKKYRTPFDPPEEDIAKARKAEQVARGKVVLLSGAGLGALTGLGLTHRFKPRTQLIAATIGAALGGYGGYRLNKWFTPPDFTI